MNIGKPPQVLERVWQASRYHRPDPPDTPADPPKAKINYWRELLPDGSLHHDEVDNVSVTYALMAIVDEHIGSKYRIKEFLRVALEEGITNIGRYGAPSEGEVIDHTKLRAGVRVEKHMIDATRCRVVTTLLFHDQGPDLSRSPEQFAQLSTAQNLQSSHGRGLLLVMQLGGFRIESERFDVHSKVIRFVREDILEITASESAKEPASA